MARQLHMEHKGSTGRVMSGIYEYYARHHRHATVATWWQGCPADKTEDEKWLAEMKELFHYVGLKVSTQGRPERVTNTTPSSKYPRSYVKVFMNILSGRAAESEAAASQRARDDAAAAADGGEEEADDAAEAAAAEVQHIDGVRGVEATRRDSLFRNFERM